MEKFFYKLCLHFPKSPIVPESIILFNMQLKSKIFKTCHLSTHCRSSLLCKVLGIPRSGVPSTRHSLPDGADLHSIPASALQGQGVETGTRTRCCPQREMLAQRSLTSRQSWGQCLLLILQGWGLPAVFLGLPLAHSASSRPASQLVTSHAQMRQKFLSILWIIKYKRI
jgi:hypothetical protein